MRSICRATLSSLVLLTILTAARPAAAQGGVGIGALAMAAFPKLDELPQGLEAKTSYGFGLWVGGNRNGRVGFVGEFIYLFKKIEGAGSVAEQQALHIPAVFHINIGGGGSNAPRGYIIAGPAFTINVNEKLSGGLAGDNFAGADIGLTGGAGFEVARIGIEGRGNWGLKNISDSGVTSNSKAFSFEVVGKIRFN